MRVASTYRTARRNKRRADKTVSTQRAPARYQPRKKRPPTTMPETGLYHGLQR